MKHQLLIAALAAASAGPALAGFVGPTDPSHFTVSALGVLGGSSPVPGSATFTASQLTLVGANAISPSPTALAPACAGGVYSVLGPCQEQAVISGAGLYSFHWAYTTADPDGPAGDLFGVIVDGSRTTLSDLGGAISQSGNYAVTAASSFGWYINCTDCIGGAATAVITNFNAASVPEPGSLALVLAAVGGMGAATLRQRRA
jgi:hypothetical protein